MRVYSLLALLALAGAAVADDQPPLPIPDTPPTPATPIVPVPDLPPVSGEPIVLYDRVEVEDRDNIPRSAVPVVISIPDPCAPGCCRYIEVCVIPDCEPRIHTSPSGRKIEYDYGEFEIEIVNRKDCVVVNYDD
jgi:hypothetical protein